MIEHALKHASRRVRRRAICPAIVIAAAALTGCATPATPTAVSCPDLSGRYENQSSPAGQPLARFFFGTDGRAEEIEIVSRDPSTLAVSTPGRNAVLAIERDYVCDSDGVRLTKTDAKNIRLPPLLVEKEIFHYVFSKAPDGALRMTEQVETQGTSFGIPIATGQKQQRSEVRWRAVSPR